MRISNTKLTVRKKVFFTVVSLTVFILGVEGVCRLLPAEEPIRIAPQIAQWDKQWKSEFWTLKGRGANRDGCRDREHALAKPAGVQRIACLGDSVTMGYGVGPNEDWPAFLEKRLLRRGHDVEVFNVAVSGWSIRQERLAYERIVRKYDVDHVILGICLNDVPEMQNNSRFSKVPSLLVFLHQHSALVRTVISAQAREIGRVKELFEDADSARVRNGWRLLFDELVMLQDTLLENQIRFSIVLFPFRFQLTSDAEPVAQRRVAEFCRERSIPMVDMLEPLEELGVEAFIDHDHLSPNGAREVARCVIRSGLLGLD